MPTETLEAAINFRIPKTDGLRNSKDMLRWYLDSVLNEGNLDQIIISLHEEVLWTTVTKLDHSQLSQKLSVGNYEVIINCLVEDHVIHQLSDMFMCFNNFLYNMVVDPTKGGYTNMKRIALNHEQDPSSHRRKPDSGSVIS